MAAGALVVVVGVATRLPRALAVVAEVATGLHRAHRPVMAPAALKVTVEALKAELEALLHRDRLDRRLVRTLSAYCFRNQHQELTICAHLFCNFLVTRDRLRSERAVVRFCRLFDSDALLKHSG